ncbi:hypothetical protein C8R46DRAFT_337862 [Mycena filopes]|nr:hypothetical protein C8R46DRAFT_337862 [Mycena filopes]
MQTLSLCVKLALLTVLASTAEGFAWECRCITNGVVNNSVNSRCCGQAGGGLHGGNCTVSDDGSGQASRGQSGEFLQCCLDNGQGAGCTEA